MTLSYYLRINIMVGAPYLQLDNLKSPDISNDKAQGKGWEYDCKKFMRSFIKPVPYRPNGTISISTKVLIALS